MIVYPPSLVQDATIFHIYWDNQFRETRLQILSNMDFPHVFRCLNCVWYVVPTRFDVSWLPQLPPVAQLPRSEIARGPARAATRPRLQSLLGRKCRFDVELFWHKKFHGFWNSNVCSLLESKVKHRSCREQSPSKIWVLRLSSCIQKQGRQVNQMIR